MEKVLFICNPIKFIIVIYYSRVCFTVRCIYNVQWSSVIVTIQVKLKLFELNIIGRPFVWFLQCLLNEQILVKQNDLLRFDNWIYNQFRVENKSHVIEYVSGKSSRMITNKIWKQHTTTRKKKTRIWLNSNSRLQTELILKRVKTSNLQKRKTTANLNGVCVPIALWNFVSA